MADDDRYLLIRMHSFFMIVCTSYNNYFQRSGVGTTEDFLRNRGQQIAGVKPCWPCMRSGIFYKLTVIVNVGLHSVPYVIRFRMSVRVFSETHLEVLFGRLRTGSRVERDEAHRLQAEIRSIVSAIVS